TVLMWMENSIHSARKLAYHPLTGKYIPVTERGERLIQNPLKPKEFILANKLVLDPLEGEFIPLRRGEKLRFSHQKNRFEIYKKVPLSERVKDFWRRIIETIF
ncbi:hypothetical protein J7J59_05430, partial [Candidatus Aerophobetes bacterium]|nr:hypothetical protein [Candidatus Aerophobetes bacterium]